MHGKSTYEFDGPGLRERRTSGGMSLRALAVKCQQAGTPISDSQISKHERGLSQPRPKVLKGYAEVFAVEIRDLLASAS
ncbi:helix-turn-helix domain-containing protein [Saccharothrix sp. AJ9571]|nr:helix-turn-helix domain-containing protein [Saccharothrix sp. AJ9571]